MLPQEGLNLTDYAEPVTVVVVMSLNNRTVRPKTRRRCFSNIIFVIARKHETIKIPHQKVVGNFRGGKTIKLNVQGRCVRHNVITCLWTNRERCKSTFLDLEQGKMTDLRCIDYFFYTTFTILLQCSVFPISLKHFQKKKKNRTRPDISSDVSHSEVSLRTDRQRPKGLAPTFLRFIWEHNKDQPFTIAETRTLAGVEERRFIYPASMGSYDLNGFRVLLSNIQNKTNESFENVVVL